MAAVSQRRITTVNCAAVNRFIMPCPVVMRVRVCVDRVSNRDTWITNSQHHTPPIRSWGLSHYRSLFEAKRISPFRGARRPMAQRGHYCPSVQSPTAWLLRMLSCRLEVRRMRCVSSYHLPISAWRSSPFWQ
jgi:hypothetical protein